MSQPAALEVGDVVAGKYRVEALLGKGGMGAVFAVVHQQRGSRHALKLLTQASRTAAERFLREGRAASTLGGRRIPAIHDQGEHGGVPYMVLELLDGEDLDRRLAKRGRLPIDEAADFVIEACAALAPAHAHGFVHRDIKPANLFVARKKGRDMIVLLDFGVAKDHKAGVLTATNSVLGSPQFISPEQLLSSRDVDHRADIWSLGATLFELLTGAAAFPGRSLPDLCTAILRQPPRSLRELRSDAPAGLASLLRDCLRKSPDERPDDVGVLAKGLSAFATERGRAVLPEVAKGLRTIKTFRLQFPEDPDPEGLAETKVASGASTSALESTLALSELAETEYGVPAPPSVPGAPSMASGLQMAARSASAAPRPAGAHAPPAQAPAPSPQVAAAPAPMAKRRHRRRRRTRAVVGLFLVVLVVAAIAGWWFGRRGTRMMGAHGTVGARPGFG